MTKAIKLFFLAVFAVVSLSAGADVVWYDGSKAVSYRCESKVEPVVEIALQMFRSDMQQVTGREATEAKDATIRIYEMDKAGASVISNLKKQGLPVDDVKAKLDAFYVTAQGENILIVGNNGRGCAYGILELSRMAGVSPWIWWGDVKPERKNRLVMKDDFKTLQSPSVEYRGIFINDEDWSLRNWAWKHYDKPADFAMGWKPYLVTENYSAYSTMISLRDGSIAFFHEDCNDNNSTTVYDLLFQRLSIETITSGTYTSTPPFAPPILGDVDGDGMICFGDVTCLIDLVLDRCSVVGHEAADVDGDSMLTIADVVALIDIIIFNHIA